MGGTRVLSFLFGIGFLTLGVMGYMPQYLVNGNLFDYFYVDDIRNIVHIVSGVLAILASFSGGASRLYFQLAGLFYGLATVLGFVFVGDLFIMHVNMADNILNLAIAVVALYLGFIASSSRH
jgi:hypothetical protein